MEEEAFYSVITLLFIFFITGVTCIYFVSKFSISLLLNVQLLLSSIVIISGAVSVSSLIIALRAAKNK
jgi:hypothetical protein